MSDDSSSDLIAAAKELYKKRLERDIPLYGVTSNLTAEQKNYPAALALRNDESSIGLSQKEMDILSLIYPSEVGNKRFQGSTYIHEGLGGDTAEHPLFAGHALDFVAGQVECKTDQDKQWLKDIISELHKRILVHDFGELIDISYTEQFKTGASYKEPAEEALVGPFKIRLAAKALAAGDADIYTKNIEHAQKELAKFKNDEFLKAEQEWEAAGKPDDPTIGNAFVDKVGKETARILGDIDKAVEDKALDNNEYDAACKSLLALLERTDKEKSKESMTFHGAAEMWLDKWETASHLCEMLGKDFVDNKVKEPETLMQRLFNEGRVTSPHVRDANSIIGYNILYTQAKLPNFAKTIEQVDDIYKPVAQKLVNAVIATTLRQNIAILQKAPPILDLRAGKDEVAAGLISDIDAQEAALSEKLAQQQNASKDWQKSIKDNRRFPISELQGVIDTKSWIAVLEKAARVIEAGGYDTASLNIPIGLGELPKEFQIENLQELHKSNKAHPLETASAYKGAEFQGSRVSI